MSKLEESLAEKFILGLDTKVDAVAKQQNVNVEQFNQVLTQLSERIAVLERDVLPNDNRATQQDIK